MSIYVCNKYAICAYFRPLKNPQKIDIFGGSKKGPKKGGPLTAGVFLLRLQKPEKRAFFESSLVRKNPKKCRCGDSKFPDVSMVQARFGGGGGVRGVRIELRGFSPT